MDKIEELLTRGVTNIIPNKEALDKLLRSGKKLNVYLGIDPTATRIHLGHTVPLRKLQQLAEQGHNVTFLIGDFTALIGDPSDKDSERPVLTKEQIQENFKTYKDQAKKILDFSRVKVRYNSEWLKDLSFEGIVKLTQHFSAGDFSGRELIRERLKQNKRVGLHELLYPVMQGYDCYFLDTDIQVGGYDQTFNMQAGRILQKDLRSKESFIITTPLLAGTDGLKMSKSQGNSIWLDDTPTDMYIKIMSVRDDLLISYYTLTTNVDLTEIKEIDTKLESSENPMEYKKRLSHIIVSEIHGKEQADEAAEHFEKTIQHKEPPTSIPVFDITNIPVFTTPRTPTSGATITDAVLYSGFAMSRSEAKRVIEQGGTVVNDRVIKDPNSPFIPEEVDGKILKVGKRKLVRIKGK